VMLAWHPPGTRVIWQGPQPFGVQLPCRSTLTQASLLAFWGRRAWAANAWRPRNGEEIQHASNSSSRMPACSV